MKIPYELYLFLKILEIMIILKEILLYNYYSFYLVFNSKEKHIGHKILKSNMREINIKNQY